MTSVGTDKDLEELEKTEKLVKNLDSWIEILTIESDL